MKDQEFTDRLSERIGQLLTDPSLFLVEVEIKGEARFKVNVFLDGDQGVTIDHCATLSRQLGEVLETEDWFDKPYVLEVSSPGLDQPLKMPRQYTANIGRKVTITTTEGKQHTGKLQEVTEEHVLLLEEIRMKNKRNIRREERTIAFAAIAETIVLVSFS
jgi:ribosome maturation factor RimP